MKFAKENLLIPNAAPWRIAIAGDWHGNRHWAKKMIQIAHKSGADFIVHVGDLGYNFDSASKNGAVFNKPLQKELEKHDMNLIWVDGNHDNHQWLQGLPRRSDGFIQTGSAGRVYYAPRGHRWTWGGITFGTLGGAYSINAHRLQEGISLFAKLEEPSIKDMETLGHEKLDILITHDVAWTVPVKKIITLDEKREKQANITRQIILEAVQRTKPDLIFSGHWHQRVTHNIVREDGGVTVQHVLDKENSPNNMVLLDIFDLDITNIDTNKYNMLYNPSY